MVDPTAFDSMKTTELQKLRAAAKVFGEYLHNILPDGADKTYTLRQFRTTVMWANVTLTRVRDAREDDQIGSEETP
jgi:hypothetical protein